MILVESLPAKVKKRYHVRKADCIVSGECTVKAKANLVCEGDLILLPGSCLTLSKGSSLKVMGKLITHEGARLISNGAKVKTNTSSATM